MSVIQSIFLGILQGIAEFLPISSSGHLKVAQELLKLEEVPLLFDIMLHLATLLAVVIFFRKKIWNLIKVLVRWVCKKERTEAEDLEDLISGTEQRGRKSIIAIILTTIVTGVIGIFTSKLIPDMPIKVTCVGFICTALLLILSSVIEKKKNKTEDKDFTGVSVKQSLFIGLMQGFGTLPGISRSGSTIAGAQLSGVNRSAAGEYSFIVSIPAILGAFILELKDFAEVGQVVGIIPVIVGCLAAFIAGYFSLAVLMKIIKKGKLEWFAVYLIPLSIIGLIIF